MQKNGFHENVSYNSFALSPRYQVRIMTLASTVLKKIILYLEMPYYPYHRIASYTGYSDCRSEEIFTC